MYNFLLIILFILIVFQNKKKKLLYISLKKIDNYLENIKKNITIFLFL